MALDHYNIWLDGALIAAVTAPITADTITGLPAGSLHRVEVSAVDTAGNESARSPLTAFTVIAPPPPPPPPPGKPPDLGHARVFATPRAYQDPQFHYPFAFTGDGFMLDETDTPEELESVAWFTLRTPPGWRPEAPGIGTPDPVFSLRPGSIIDSALAQADERINALVGEARDGLEVAVARILVQIGKAEQP